MALGHDSPKAQYCLRQGMGLPIVVWCWYWVGCANVVVRQLYGGHPEILRC